LKNLQRAGITVPYALWFTEIATEITLYGHMFLRVYCYGPDRAGNLTQFAANAFLLIYIENAITIAAYGVGRTNLLAKSLLALLAEYGNAVKYLILYRTHDPYSRFCRI
jgi:hypothetical protein